MSEKIPMEIGALTEQLEKTLDNMPLGASSEKSAFAKDLIKKLFKAKSPEETVAEGSMLITSLEQLLSRQVKDSQLIIGICVARVQITGHPASRVIAVVKNALGRHDMPSLGWIEKNIKAAKIIEEHPGLSAISDVEKIVTLNRLPPEIIMEAAETGEFVAKDGGSIKIQEVSRKNLQHEVREVIGKAKKRLSKDEAESIVDGDEAALEGATAGDPIVAADVNGEIKAGASAREELITRNKASRVKLVTKIDAAKIFMKGLKAECSGLHKDDLAIIEYIDQSQKALDLALHHLKAPLKNEDEEALFSPEEKALITEA
jgi:hypothetical protein